MSMALMLSGEKQSVIDLFVKVAELSYLGDIWMRSKAEHPDKVWNIVLPHASAFFEYYKNTLVELEEKGVF